MSLSDVSWSMDTMMSTYCQLFLRIQASSNIRIKKRKPNFSHRGRRLASRERACSRWELNIYEAHLLPTDGCLHTKVQCSAKFFEAKSLRIRAVSKNMQLWFYASVFIHFAAGQGNSLWTEMYLAHGFRRSKGSISWGPSSASWHSRMHLTSVRKCERGQTHPLIGRPPSW